MRLRYFGQSEGYDRIAVLEWNDMENSIAQKVVGRLFQSDWKIKKFDSIAYIRVEDRKDFNKLMAQYKEIKKALL